MAAKSICDVCKKERDLEVSPLGVALMPPEWYVTVRNQKCVDVCSDLCAQAYDMEAGMKETFIHDMGKDGDEIEREIKHKVN